ncbi:Ribosomal-protein-serine acetyltransferase [subsurface metagenome]
MAKVELRPQRVSDAKRFYQIIKNPNFEFMRIPLNSIKDEIKFLKQNASRRRKNFAYNYTILCDGEVVGGCGIKIDQHRTFNGEISYFIDQAYWGRGIATQAVKKLEKVGFDELKLKRIEIIMNVRHKASEKVAIKCGYKKEGVMKKATKTGKSYYDAFLYAKAK